MGCVFAQTLCCYYCFDVFVVAEVALLCPLVVLASWLSRKRRSCHLVHGVHGYYVCSVSDRVLCSVLAICRCIAPCARCQDLFNSKTHTRVQMPRDEFSKMWRGNSLEARKKARKKKRKFPIFSKLGWIGMCFCLNSLLLLLFWCLCCCRNSTFVFASCADFLEERGGK